MKVTRKTLLKDVFPFINEDILNKVMDVVKDEDMKGFETIFSFNVGQLIRLLRNDKEFYNEYFKGKNITLFEFAARIKHLKSEIEKTIKYLKSLEIKQNEDEKKASHGIKFPSFEENILIFCQQKFLCKSIDEAEKIMCGDFFLLFKCESAKRKYEINLRQLQLSKK